MTHWRPITTFEPEGDGLVLLWCHQTDWVRTCSASAVRDMVEPDGIVAIDHYEYLRFAYIDHPFPVPEHHPYYGLAIKTMVSAGERDILLDTIGERAESYADFTRDEHARWYQGQERAAFSYMPHNHYRLLFKTKEERLLADIALAQKRP